MADPSANVFSRCSQGYFNTLDKFVSKVSKANGRLGGFITRRPVTVLLLSILAVILCGLGFLRFRLENDGDKLWVPQHSKAKDDEKWVKAAFGVSGGGASFVCTVKDQYRQAWANNVLRPEIAWEAFKVDAAVRSITVQDGATTYTWDDLCFTNYNGTCDYDGFLNFWNMNFNTYLAEVGGSATDPTVGNAATLLQTVNEQHFPDNSSVSTLSIFGGIVITGAPGPLYMSSAEVISIGYGLRNDLPDKVEENWYKKFGSTIEDIKAQLTYTQVSYISGNSVDKEIGRSVSKDLYLIALSVAIFVIIAIVGMSRFDAVATRTTLGIIGVVSAVLGVLAGYGLSLLFGVPFTTLQQTLPYILLGVAVDCMFILGKSYDVIIAQEPHLNLSQRFEKLMETAGLGVAVTLLASTVAFALGTTSVLPSIQWFSIYATMGVFCILIVILTFFVSVFVLMEKRIARNRLDCLCCIKRQGPPPSTAAPLSDSPSVPVATAIPMMAPMTHQAYQGKVINDSGDFARTTITHPSADKMPVLPSQGRPHLFKMLFERYYAPFITWWPAKVVLLACFIAWIVLSALAINKLQEGQPLSEIAPDDSYLQDYIRIQKETFQQQVGSPTYMYFRNLDPSPPAVQVKMLEAVNLALQDSYFNSTISAFQGNWLISFLAWVPVSHPEVSLTTDGCFNPYTGNVHGDLGTFVHPPTISGCVPQANFYPLLFEYLSSSRGFRSDLRFNTDTAGNPVSIRTSRVSVVHEAEADNDKYGKEIIHHVRDVEKEVNDDLFAQENSLVPDDIFLIYQGDYIYNEGDAILGRTTMEYILLALLGVGIVMLVMLVSPRATLLMIIAVGLVDLFLFGEMWVLSIRFNQVSVINMVMATGLAVDYSVYFAQKFMMTEADGTLDGRVRVALADTGSAVFLGGLTAMSGTVPLAFASSTILRTFFALLFGTILFSLLVGLMLMPILFSLIGPPPLTRARQSQPGLPTAVEMPSVGNFHTLPEKQVTVRPGSGSSTSGSARNSAS